MSCENSDWLCLAAVRGRARKSSVGYWRHDGSVAMSYYIVDGRVFRTLAEALAYKNSK